MKAIYFLIPLFIVNSCKTQTGSVISSDKSNMEQSENYGSDCPDGGTCNVVVHQNKSLQFIEDGVGNPYTEITDGKNLVVEFTYFKAGPEGTADGNYTETLQFEIPDGAEALTKENASLADVKLMFGKQGFRMSSYYPVTSGKLTLKKTGQTLSFDLKFKVDETSQVISHISEKVKL